MYAIVQNYLNKNKINKLNNFLTKKMKTTKIKKSSNQAHSRFSKKLTNLIETL